MKITIEVEPVKLPCMYGHDDGSTTYYGFRIIGLKDKYGEDVIVCSSMSRYPGNDVVRAFINSANR